MMKKFKMFLFLGMTVLLITGCGASVEEVDLLVDEIVNSGKISPLEELSYDWGDISIDGGDVEHEFHFKNDSDSNLVLKGAVTSCMCTIARIELPDGTLSPDFGMHSGKDWSYVVSAGEEFEVEVVYDPMAHGPDAVGPLQRSVYLFTSSIDNGEYTEVDQESGGMVTELKVSTEVLYDDDYQEKYGDLGFIFEEAEFDFGLLKQSSGLISHDFEFEYVGNDPVTVTAVPASCACTSATISQNDFVKGDRGVLIVEFDPNLHEEPEGVFFKTVSLLTEPTLEKQPEIKVWAEIDLDLGEEFYKLKEEHVE